MCCSGLLIGLVTPGRIGEFGKMAYLKKDNHSLGLGRAFLGTFLDKIFDLLFVSIITVSGFLLLPFLSRLTIDFYRITEWLGLTLLLLLISFGFFYLKNKEKLRAFLSEIFNDIKRFRTANILYLFFLTAGAWFFYFLGIYLVAASINLQGAIGFFYVAFASAIAQMATLLPISVLGVGTREAVLIFLLTPLGIPKETIILFSLLIMINYISLFAISFYCWLKKPLI